MRYGVIGLFPEIKPVIHAPGLERLVLMVSEARPSLSQQAILRIAEAVPLTLKDAAIERVSQILASYGRSCSDQPADKNFWYRIQRTLEHLGRMKKSLIKGRRKEQRKRTFFLDKDPIHKRLELLRELFFGP